ncbi:hypothetical protein H5410_021861 [Solanum commersonii]|uniref:Uncharacterized protein n=1 Tax=Solanum commersonii TaxID=4109 RepID=A0A9J5ZGH4_SOLCO|nr:hypothetical protein H5410_021861 [Solanum commersonii]
MKWNSQRIAEQSHEAVPYQRLKMRRGSRLKLEGDEIDQTMDCRVYWRSRITSPKGPLQHKFSNTINTSKTLILGCFWLAQERGRKTKTTKLLAGGIRSTWVQLERVNPSPSPIHLARESEWAKAEAMLNAVTQCLRETELI